MAFIEVDPQELLDASSRIQAALPISNNISSGGSLGETAGASGRSDVANAIGSFLDHWHYGLSCMNQDAQHLADLLRRSGLLYEQAEAEIVAAER
jgi:hypothetical protein